MAGYNRTRSVEEILENTQALPPTFTVHLHSDYWVLNNGSKFLYHNQIASLLDDIRAHRIPVDFLELFDSARVPFYEGCMIVELLDYRPLKSQEPALKDPQKTRVVLHPNPETLWADICTLNQKAGGKWSDMDALEVEAKILLATSPPLCLDPDPHLTRIVNQVVRVSTPTTPLSLKRKASALEPEENGPEKAKRERLLTFMAPREARHGPTYSLLEAYNRKRAAADPNQAGPAVAAGPWNSSQTAQPTPPATVPQTPIAGAGRSLSPTEATDNKPSGARKNATPQISGYSPAFISTDGSHTPVPAQPTHQFVNQHPPTTAPAIQPQVYNSFKEAQEAANNLSPAAVQQQPQQQQQYVYQLPQPSTQPQLQTQQPQPQTQSSQQGQVQQSSPQQIQPAPPRPYTQSPKPPGQTNVTNVMNPPNQTPQSFQASTPQFQPSIPNSNYLQPPPGSRIAQKPQIANGSQQSQPQQSQSQPTPAQPLASSSNAPIGQALYPQQQQQAHMLMAAQQRAGALAATNAQKTGGRVTPLIQNPAQARSQPLVRPQSPAVPATPSPARGSPLVTQQQPAPGSSAARSSPMPPKAQIPQQQNQVGQNQQQLLASQSMQMPNRSAFASSQYNSSQMRLPMTHGSPAAQGQMMLPPTNGAIGNGQATTNGTAAITAPSPRLNGRPITPAVNVVGPDGKPSPQQQQQHNMHMQMQMQSQQAAMRRQTPLQQAQQQVQQQQQVMNAASPQAQQLQLHAAQAKAQAAQYQALAAHAQAQQAAQQQQQQASPQNQSVIPQQPQLSNQPSQQQMTPYPQIYNSYPQGFNMWTPRMQGGANLTPQQMQQQMLQHQRMMQQQQQQQQQGAGSSVQAQGMMPNLTQQQLERQQQIVRINMFRAQQAAQAAQAGLLHQQQSPATAVSGQQEQGGMTMGNVIPAGVQLSQAAMMGKILPQGLSQVHAQQAHAQLLQAQMIGKGKMMLPKKVPPPMAAKPGGPQR